MELKRCPNGHFYDASKFTTCPHCQNAGASTVNETVSFAASANDGNSPTISAGTPSPGIITETVPLPPVVKPPEISDPASKPTPSDDIITQGYFDNVAELEVDPVVGWLVCTEGKHKGEGYPLKTGRNFIGRGPEMDVPLSGEPTVSRKTHAIIAYEPRQNIFIAQPGSASELFYLNNKDVVLNSVPIKRNDRLQIGEAELMLIPCCDENFQWKKSEKSDKQGD